eukprot:2796798-Prymnesium_polylepis.1
MPFEGVTCHIRESHAILGGAPRRRDRRGRSSPQSASPTPPRKSTARAPGTARAHRTTPARRACRQRCGSTPAGTPERVVARRPDRWRGWERGEGEGD